MKLSEIKKQLKKIREDVAEVTSIIQDEGYFKQAKKFLNQSAKELDEDNILESVEFVKKAKESASKEKEIRNKLKEVQSLINKKLTGANPKDAEKYTANIINFLQNGKVDEADRLIDKAKIAAQPSPEYLLQNARNYYSNGLKKYEQENFQDSIKIWKSGIEEYRRARNIAEEKKDQNIIKNIDNTVSNLENCIKDAEISFDNREMVKFDNEAINKIEKTKELIDQHKYDDGILILDDAAEDIKKALQLAKKRKFEEDREKIERRKKNMKKRKEFYQIEKGKYLLQETIKHISKEPEKNEKELYNLLEYLESLKIKSEGLKRTIEDCKKGIIKAKLEQAKKNMTEAENLYKKGKYYDARGIYEKNQEYLRKVEDEAGKFNVASIIDDIRKLRTICIENRDSCNSQFFNLPDAPERKLISTKESPDFILPMKERKNLFPTDKNTLEKLGRKYDVLDHIGSGGFADVYKAKWKAKNMIVALKIPRELTSSDQEFFFKEIRMWEQLKHRNIVKLIKPQVDPPHLIIEYIKGTTLHELLQSPKMEVKKACRIAYDMATGLKYTHSNYIIHCDLKPKNILINELGEAKITDFGIAKTAIATTSGSRGGHSLIYAAPEQLKGNPETATDIYQLGLVLYQMITGRNPFDVGSDVEVEKAIFEDMPEPPSMYNNDSKPLDDIIMMCLAKNVDERPTIENVRDTLYEYMKRYHGESLHITKDNKSYLRMAFDGAFIAAKHGDISECILYFKSAKGKAVKASLRKKIDNFVKQLETFEEENTELGSKTIEEVGRFLREII